MTGPCGPSTARADRRGDRRLVGVVGPDAGSPLLLTELAQLGGALGRPAEGGGALSKLEAEFVMFGVGVPMTPELGEALPGALDRLHDAIEPWSADGGYFNFAERPCDLDALLPPETCERLAEVKRAGDDHAVARSVRTHLRRRMPAR